MGEPSNKSLFSIQNKEKWFKDDTIKIPYPVIYIDDIEIHLIHKNNFNDSLSEFNKRYDRMKKIINSNDYQIIALFSFSELLNDHENINLIINKYFKNSDNIIIKKYFLGPEKYNDTVSFNESFNLNNSILDSKFTKNNHYISIQEWNNISLERTNSHIYKFNDQAFITNKFYTNLKL